MRTVVNDEIEVEVSMTRDRKPTTYLRFRDVEHNRMLLEQLWEAKYQGGSDQWVPVKFVESFDKSGAR